MKPLYHGTIYDFEEIDVSAGKGYKDFGKGFYATTVPSHVEWLRFILQNRKCNGCTHDYDIVIGPTADAETTTIVNEYYDELEESGYSDEVCDKVIAELKPENLPKQYFFRTPEAVNTLSFDKVKRQVIG